MSARSFSWGEIIAAVLLILRETAGGLRDVSDDLDIIVEAVNTTKARLEGEGITIEQTEERSLDADRIAEQTIHYLKQKSSPQAE